MSRWIAAVSPDPFVHLHVASGYSMQYGASHPHVLVEKAVEHEMDALALTDRDGTYGAVKFVQACRSAGIRPLLGVDLAVEPLTARLQARASTPRRTPVRGGAVRELPLGEGGAPRVTLLAQGAVGWAAVCRMISEAHLTGERGRPVGTLEAMGPYLASGDVVVLLGPTSELGALVTHRRADLAREVIDRWREVVPSPNLVVELVSHRLGASTQGWGPGTSPHAARMMALARQAGVPTVLTNAVRHADRLDAPVIDVLDAARRRVPLGSAHLRQVGPGEARGNAEGFLKSGKQMHEVATSAR